MRAIVVELAEDPKLLAFGAGDDADAGEGDDAAPPRPHTRPVTRGEGSLAPRPRRSGAGAAEGEPD
jgi:hypothetical protein